MQWTQAYRQMLQKSKGQSLTMIKTTAPGITMLKSIKHFMDRHINYGMAFAGAGFLGVTVFVINLSHGIPLALVAAAKQATYTFFAAGFITRNSERLAVRWHNRWLSLLMSITVSTGIAVGLTLLVHTARGTPEPFHSTIPTIVHRAAGLSDRRPASAAARPPANSTTSSVDKRWTISSLRDSEH